MLSPQQREALRSHRTDMSAVYPQVCSEQSPNSQLVLDRFHVAKHLGELYELFKRVPDLELPYCFREDIAEIFDTARRRRPSRVRYPRCIQEKRACPPKDVGGVWGYADVLEAIRNPKHEQHAELLEWHGGKFAPKNSAWKPPSRQ